MKTRSINHVLLWMREDLVLRKKYFFTLLAVLGLLTNLSSQTPRNNYNARLEVEDLVLHGAGQDPVAFADYYNWMPEDNKPLIYMDYYSLNALNSEHWVDALKRQLEQYPTFLVPQIGLSMTSPDGDPSGHYEQAVADGDYDAQIANLAAGLKHLGRPVYLRIGYEFNGTAWNGYLPDAYVAAYQRITDALRDENVEVATVWCAAVGGGTDENYLDYYPGDDYVDWWGIDLFSDTHFSEPVTASFMADADSSGKPVMIGETTPRYIGADNAEDWEDWFLLYFNFIENNPGVKATCYINWDWAEWPQWSDWGNAQLGGNDFVRVNYVHRHRNDLYFHGASQSAFRAAQNIADNTAPAAPAVSTSASGTLPIWLYWSPIADPSEVVYLIYKNGAYYSSTYNTEWVDFNFAAGQTISYEVRAMDWAGNESGASNPITHILAETIKRSINSEFSGGTIYPWSLDTYEGAAASFSLPNDDLNIDIENPTGTNWHIQLVQRFEMLEQNEYWIEATAQSSNPGTAGLVLQQSQEPFGIPIFESVTLQNNNGDFSSSNFTATSSERMNVGIYLGELPQGSTVGIERLELWETDGRDDFVENVAPDAQAGDDFTFDDPMVVLDLDGTNSTDPDGSISTYLWEQLSGEAVLTLDSPNDPVSKLSDVVTGEYVFRLTVNDEDQASNSDDILVNITVLPLVNTEEIANKQVLGLSPNPTTGLLQFQIGENVATEDLRIRILNTQGQIMPGNPPVPGAAGQYDLDVGNLATGTYILQVISTERTFVGTFVVE